MSVSSITHTMPVSLPVKRYLEAWKPGVYMANQYEFLGMWLINAMSKKTVQVTEITQDNIIAHELVEKWHYAIPARYEDSRVIGAKRVIQFNKMILKFMHAEIIALINERELAGQTAYIQRSIDDFRNEYGILEKHFEDYRIRKMYQRFKKRSENNRLGALTRGFPAMILGTI